MSVCGQILTPQLRLTIVEDVVTKFNRYVVKITMKAEFEDGDGPSKGSGSREVGSRKEAIAPPNLYAPGPHSF